MAYIYTHTRLDNNSIFYIGIGSDNNGKYKRAHVKSTRGTHWKRIVNKYGYSISIVKDNLTWNEACNEEIYLIKKYGRLDLGEGLLINKTNGGEGFYGGIFTDEAKLKISKGNKGKSVTDETKIKISKARKGFTHTDEAKLKISQAHSGRKHSEQYKEDCRKRNIGKKLSEETKEKLRNRLWTNEDKQKLSEAQKNSYKNGRVSANKGKSPSEETKLKLSIATKLYWENKKKKLC